MLFLLFIDIRYIDYLRVCVALLRKELIVLNRLLGLLYDYV